MYTQERLTGVGKPICVDLDGTLVNTDLVLEGLLSLLSNPKLYWSSSSLLAGFSRAHFKQQLAKLVEISPELLPYNTELLDYLKAQRQSGRRIVLATAADARTSQIIADYLGIFDDIIASDGEHNLKGAAKANELVRRFGHKGFDYAGNDRADLAVWQSADQIIIVNASETVRDQAATQGSVTLQISNRPPLLPTAWRAARPHQWVKNLLVFVPLLTSHSFTNRLEFLNALCAFVSFCATASAIYLFNDLMDLQADRSHPRKQRRPLASGTISLTHGALMGAVLLAAGIALAAAVGVMSLVIVYAVISILYSLGFKRYPLLDVFILAGLYTSRIIVGGEASGHRASMWLVAFSGFAFLSLALVKRVGEIRDNDRSVEKGSETRRGYSPHDRSILLMFGCASAFSSGVVLALYVSSLSALEQYKTPEILWGLVPLILFWQCRLWLSTARGVMHDDPIMYATRDWVSWLTGLGVVIVMLAAI
jgi:4-hydroxybenzoate polyprenyltransferase